MNKIGNLLWKLFSMTMVFVCHIDTRSAFAENITKNPRNDQKLVNYFTDTNSVAPNDRQKRTICGSGQYLSSCGGTTVGVAWLQGMTKNKDLPEDSAATYTAIQTPDYYSYNADSSEENMENLREFFAGTNAFMYKKKDGNYASASPEDASSTIGYIKYRNQILSNFCTDSTGHLDRSKVICQKCPNDANVSASTVDQEIKFGSYEFGQILWDTWNVHTIADCYMNEFSDDTGTYVYVDNSTSTESAGKKCYYSKEIFGKNLYYR